MPNYPPVTRSHSQPEPVAERESRTPVVAGAFSFALPQFSVGAGKGDRYTSSKAKALVQRGNVLLCRPACTLCLARSAADKTGFADSNQDADKPGPFVR